MRRACPAESQHAFTARLAERAVTPECNRLELPSASALRYTIPRAGALPAFGRPGIDLEADRSPVLWSHEWSSLKP
jgi:hypothetical protein